VVDQCPHQPGAAAESPKDGALAHPGRPGHLVHRDRGRAMQGDQAGCRIEQLGPVLGCVGAFIALRQQVVTHQRKPAEFATVHVMRVAGGAGRPDDTPNRPGHADGWRSGKAATSEFHECNSQLLVLAGNVRHKV